LPIFHFTFSLHTHFLTYFQTFMHTFFLSNRLGRWLTVTLLALLSVTSARAQLTGTKAIPGDYATVAAAITALNAGGVGAGGVTFNVAAGYTETFASPAAGLITATGTAANPIVFQKAGSGANPVLTAGVGTSTTVDAIIGLAGSDYVTFDGLSVAENAANTTPTTQAEFGFALFRASATDGAQNNTIRNCVVTLSKTNTGTIGIYGAPNTSATSTAVTASATTGANSNNKVYGNVVTNALTGIYFAAGSSTTVANYDQNNEIGVTAGNTIGNFGGTASGYGAGGTYQNGLKISGNTLNNTLNYTSATASTAVTTPVTSTLRGIYTPSGSAVTLDITNNTVTLASGATTSQLSGIENSMGGSATGSAVNITGNTVSFTYTTAGAATIYGIFNSASPAALNISNNTLNNSTFATSGTSSTYLISNSTSATNITVANNQISGITRTGTTGTLYGYYNNGSGAGTQALTNNVFNNISVAGSTTFYGLYNTSSSSETQLWSGNQITNFTAATGSVYGIYNAYGNTGSQFFNNTVTGLSGGGTVYGINLTNTSLTTAAAYGNTVGGLNSSGASSTVYGIYTSGVTTTTVYRNKVYDLSASGATAVVYGLYNTGGTTITYHNNLVGDLRASASTNLNAVAGLYISSGTTVNAYYNTINLNASSTGATFGTSGIYFTSTPTTVDLRNNIVVNKSTAAGTGGYTAALRRSTGTAATVPANLATTSNNNLYYAGTPSATNLIYVEGTTTATNAQQTLAAYKTFLANREQASVTEDVPFLSTTGTAATFLHINPSVATQVESGGAAISGITTDFDNDARNASTPDIGADEGTFTPRDLTGPSIVFTPLGNTSSTGNRTLTVTITDPSGVVATGANAPRLFYRKGTTGAFLSDLAISTSNNSFGFVINAAALGGLAAGDIVQYYVVAQDVPGNVSSNPGGGTFTTQPSTPSQYTILNGLAGVYFVGNSTTSPDPTRTYATLTAAAAAYNTSGLGGAVTFLLLETTYSTGETFPVAFGNNPEASATNTLTIRPYPGVTTTITSASSGLAFSNSRYIILDGSNVAGGTTRNLTVTSTSTTAGAYGIGLISTATTGPGNQFVTVRNTNVVSGSNTAATFGIYVGNGPDNDNITLTNNSVQGSYYGIYAFGSTTTSAGGMDNLVVSNNVVGPATASATANIGLWGIFVSNAVAASITGNEVQNVIGANTNNLHGIYLVDTKNAVVSRNTVHNLAYTGSSTYKVWAINSQQTNLTTAANPSAVRLDNNLVYNINSTTASATWNTSGINLGGGYGDQIVYNTVYLSGQLSAAGGTAGSAAFANGNPSVTNVSTNIDVRNNIFAIIGGTGGITTTPLYAHYEQGTTVTGSTLNYNDLYVTTGATGAAVIGRLNSTDYATLAAWQTATGQEANSLSVDPQFAQTAAVPYNLTPTNIALNNAGTPIAGVTVDYTGATRGSVPDIGAYEFTPLTNDLAATGLVAPASASTCYGTAEPVSVSIRNAGTATLNFATSPATVTVVVTLPGGTTQTFTTTLNTGTLASGATQTVVLPGTLNMSTVGTYSFAITATVTGDGNTTNDLLAPSPTRTVVAPVAGTLATASATICVSGTATLTLTGAANGAIQYQSSPDNVTFTDIAGATSAAYTTPVLTSTTYFRAQVRCSSGTATSNVSTITVNNPLVASTNTPVNICAGSTATLTATASAGASVRFFSAATGGTALATATAGSYTTPALTASTTYYAEAFTGGTSVAGLTDNSASNGTFSQSTSTDYPLGFAVTQAGTLTSVDVYPTAAGTLTIRLYSVNGTQPTGTATAVAGSDVTIAVTAAQVGTRVTVPLNYTLAAGDYKLSNLAGGLGRFSTYSGTYPLTSADGVLSIKGSYTFFTSTSYSNTTYNSFFNLTFSNECVGSAARTAIQVNVTQPATASFPAATASTCGTSAYTLAGTVGGSATTGTYTSSGTGTFSPNATTLGATYTPSAADVAAGSVTITLTALAAPCTPATATLALSITAAPVATFSYPTATTYCAGSTSTVTPALGTGATAGTFSSTTGLSLNATTGVITLGTSTAGTYTVTNTVAASGACAAVSATATVTITPATSATFAYTGGTFCVTGTTSPTPTVTGTAGGTFSSTTGLSINATTGAITLSSSTPGTYTVTYTVAGACGSSSTQSVTISTAPLATFSYGTSPTYCVSGTANPAPSFGTGASGGVFSSTTGLSLNASTGVISLSASTPGTYTVTNTIAANGGCAAATATTQVTITAAPVATFSYPTATTYCAGSTSTVTPTLGTGATAGTFSSTAGLSLNATTGVITLGTSTAGTYTVTNTVAAAGGCAAATATTTVTITPATSATFAYSGTTFCATGTNPTPTMTGTAGGTFSATTGLSINATTGAITLSSSTPGTYTVTYAVAGACGSSATAQVTITSGQVATFSYATSAGCVGSASAVTPTLGTGATAGTFSSTAGLTINATTGAITLATSTAGTYTVTNTVAATGGCATATATTTFTVNPRPATPTISVAYNGPTTTLTSSAPTGNQWYLGGNPVTGATGQTLVLTGLPSQLGSYTVTTTNANGCVSLPSSPLVVTSAKNGIAGASLRLYPNPTPNGQVTLELTGYRLATQLTVLDALGRAVTSELLPANAGTATHALDLTGVATGVYLLRLSNADGVETRRLVRE
jgi:hypothetical protein